MVELQIACAAPIEMDFPEAINGFDNPASTVSSTVELQVRNPIPQSLAGCSKFQRGTLASPTMGARASKPRSRVALIQWLRQQTGELWLIRHTHGCGANLKAAVRRVPRWNSWLNDRPSHGDGALSKVPRWNS